MQSTEMVNNLREIFQENEQTHDSEKLNFSLQH